MPSTPSAIPPDGAEGDVIGAGDTERPPPEPTRVGAPPDPALLAIAKAPPLRAAPPNKPPSSARLVAAPPSTPRVPAAPPPPPPAAPAPPPRVATILGAGLPEAPRGPATVPAPPPGQGAPDVIVSVVARDGSTMGFGDGVPLTRRCSSCETRYPADFVVCPRDATPLVDDASDNADPLVGKLLGDTYQVVRLVGEGGMGRVYEARHLRLKERRFAVKALHADLARNPEIVARFMREAESASSLSHPNVVDVLDVHHLADGTPYFVAELLEGEELAEYVRARGPLDPRLAASVGRQVCRALAAAHARGIVHRDMKPENIFVLRSSIEAMAAGEVTTLTVKVLDFGISKAGGDENTHLTKTGMIMGTPSYMAPEQARGKQVDLRADIYSVGAVLYYAITGRRPFDSDDPTATLSMVLTQDPVRPRAIDPRIPEALELVVQRAMAKDPRERHPSMADLEKALASIEEGSRLARAPAAPIEPAFDPSRTSAQRAFDVARRMFATSTPPPGQSAVLARIARPTIVVTSAVLGAWLVGGTTAALAGLVRVLHDGEITLTECVLLVVGCLFAAATPIALYVLHVKKVIWPNSVRALQLASDLKRTATAALVTYGALSIVARIGHTVLWRTSRGLASGFWDIVLFLASLLAAGTIGGFAPLLRNMRRRRSSSS